VTAIVSVIARLADSTLFRAGAYINGQWVTEGTAGAFTVRNPSTNEVIAELPSLGRKEVAETVEAANRALPAWRALSGKDRSQILRRWFDLVTENIDDLATIITLEEGKPLSEARGEIAYAASFIEWFAEEAKRVRGDVFLAPNSSRRIVVLKEPIGVCAAITPWNFPAAMITRKAAPALAAGCTMLVKPAKQTPLTALALAELGERAGIPAGVFNVVVGDARTIGSELTSNPSVRKLTFTGSTEVGRTLIEQSASTIKKVSMELGGNAPAIVFDDTDMETALAGVLAAKYRNTGQSCIGANRIYVQAGIYEQFASAFAERAAQLQVGDGFDPAANVGPLIDTAAMGKVAQHVEDAVSHGARVLTGGNAHTGGGLFFQPTVLTEVTQAMQVAREETFGPIAPLIKFTDEADVIRMANDTEFGLASYLFSTNAERIWRVSAALETGMVGINTGLISNEVAPFGGIKQSGIGREGSVYGIDEYLEIKYLSWEGAGAL
jgi:succinate-semialdehyde dehydrogenase/glutarate-semialdehyde dehydrogenase